MSGTSLSRWRSRFLIALGLTTVTMAVALSGGYWYIHAKWSNADAVDLETDLGPSANYLVVGSDSREFVTTEQDAESFGDVTGTRADTIMVVRVDPKTRDAMLVSFPRDLWVEIPGQGSAKINSAFNDSPQLLIDTLRHNFGIPIHHYVQVDFAGFRNIVDAMGGVEMYVAGPARDPKTGLDIKDGGCVTLDGDQALAWVRSRNFQAYESGTWRTDGTGDFGRISRQQDFLRRLMAQGIQSGASNPVRGDRVIDRALDNLIVDTRLGVNEVLKLARAFRSADPEEVEMISLPADVGSRGGQSVVILDEAKAAPTFERLRGEGTGDGEVTPSEVRIRVLNGNGESGIARRIARLLQTEGFQAPEFADADTYGYEQTELRYRAGNQAAAELVREYFGGVGRLVESADTGAADVVAVLGRDFRGVVAPTEGDGDATAELVPIASVRPQTSTTAPPAGGGEPQC